MLYAIHTVNNKENYKRTKLEETFISIFENGHFDGFIKSSIFIRLLCYFYLIAKYKIVNIALVKIGSYF